MFVWVLYHWQKKSLKDSVNGKWNSSEKKILSWFQTLFLWQVGKLRGRLKELSFVDEFHFLFILSQIHLPFRIIHFIHPQCLECWVNVHYETINSNKGIVFVIKICRKNIRYGKNRKFRLERNVALVGSSNFLLSSLGEQILNLEKKNLSQMYSRRTNEVFFTSFQYLVNLDGNWKTQSCLRQIVYLQNFFK